MHGVVVIVRWLWAFVGWLTSFLGGQGHFWHWVCVKWYGSDVVGGWMCTIVGRCVVLWWWPALLGWFMVVAG